jgi:RNA polymerase sigma-70 factor (ECF subfamily)
MQEPLPHPNEPVASSAEAVEIGRFPTTHWGAVLQAGQTDSPAATEALEQLCVAYWYPLYAYVRRQGNSPEDAQDLTQEFFARLLARNYLSLADPARGKFRSRNRLSTPLGMGD